MGTEPRSGHGSGPEILVASNEVAVELSYLQKLWNRGVDIGVGVITSIIVGLIGLAFWRAKLWLDLRAAAKMQHQQHRIAEEFETEKRRQAARVRRDNLRTAMETLAKRAETVSNAFQLADCWEHYYQWLLDNQLYQNPRKLQDRHRTIYVEP